MTFSTVFIYSLYNFSPPMSYLVLRTLIGGLLNTASVLYFPVRVVDDIYGWCGNWSSLDNFWCIILPLYYTHTDKESVRRKVGQQTYQIVCGDLLLLLLLLLLLRLYYFYLQSILLLYKLNYVIVYLVIFIIYSYYQY
jgi:hypothetical protein